MHYPLLIENGNPLLFSLFPSLYRYTALCSSQPPTDNQHTNICSNTQTYLWGSSLSKWINRNKGRKKSQDDEIRKELRKAMYYWGRKENINKNLMNPLLKFVQDHPSLTNRFFVWKLLLSMLTIKRVLLKFMQLVNDQHVFDTYLCLQDPI